jgi:anaerobic nitric oxide reductase transcription regulator
MVAASADALGTQDVPAQGLRERVQAYECQLVRDALARHHGNWASAARELQMDRANLQRLAKRLGVARHPAAGIDSRIGA